MPSAVIDTHVLLWHTLDRDRLSQNAVTTLEACERDGAVLSSVSMWEIAVKAKRGGWEFPISVKAYEKRLAKMPWLEIRCVDVETWLASVELDWPHRDPADRVIVATASALGLPLVTKDSAMHAFYNHCVW